MFQGVLAMIKAANEALTNTMPEKVWTRAKPWNGPNRATIGGSRLGGGSLVSGGRSGGGSFGGVIGVLCATFIPWSFAPGPIPSLIPSSILSPDNLPRSQCTAKWSISRLRRSTSHNFTGGARVQFDDCVTKDRTVSSDAYEPAPRW